MTASPTSCCSVYIESVVDTPAGRFVCGFSTGFLYAGPNATRWLVTNWHVVTGRRPDVPGILIGRKPSSPKFLRFSAEDPSGGGRQLMELALYDKDGPTWIEADREGGVDLALLRLSDKPNFALPFSQTFAPNTSKQTAPGAEVVIVGHPFELGRYARSAIWKSAMIASDPGSGEDPPWVLVDAPGMPGMSGSPVYRKASELSSSGATGLELLGVYAGAVGDGALEALRLGRVFPVELVERILKRRERGHNPFPP